MEKLYPEARKFTYVSGVKGGQVMAEVCRDEMFGQKQVGDSSILVL